MADCLNQSDRMEAGNWPGKSFKVGVNSGITSLESSDRGSPNIKLQQSYEQNNSSSQYGLEIPIGSRSSVEQGETLQNSSEISSNRDLLLRGNIGVEFDLHRGLTQTKRKMESLSKKIKFIEAELSEFEGIGVSDDENSKGITESGLDETLGSCNSKIAEIEAHLAKLETFERTHLDSSFFLTSLHFKPHRQICDD